MFQDQDTSILNTYFGTHSPFWRLAFDSQALELSAIKEIANIAIPLNSVQTMKIRGLTGITASLDIEIEIYGHPFICILLAEKLMTKSGEEQPQPMPILNLSLVIWLWAFLLQNRLFLKPTQ